MQSSPDFLMALLSPYGKQKKENAYEYMKYHYAFPYYVNRLLRCPKGSIFILGYGIYW